MVDRLITWFKCTLPLTPSSCCTAWVAQLELDEKAMVLLQPWGVTTLARSLTLLATAQQLQASWTQATCRLPGRCFEQGVGAWRLHSQGVARSGGD